MGEIPQPKTVIDWEENHREEWNKVEINHNKKENIITRKLKESVLSVVTTQVVISKSNLYEQNMVPSTA